MNNDLNTWQLLLMMFIGIGCYILGLYVGSNLTKDVRRK